MDQYPGKITEHARMLAAGLAVATLALAGCSSDGSESRSDHTTTTIDQSNIDVLTSGDASQAESISDADLKAYDASTTNCGGKIRDEAHPEAFFNSWIDYANQNPELAPQQMDLFDTLLGTEATDEMLKHGYLNPDTSLDKRIDGDNYRENELAHRMTRIQITEDLTLANTTCIDGNGNVNVGRAAGKPIIHLSKGQYVEAVVTDDTGTAAILQKAKKMADGGIAFVILPLGKVQVNENGQMVEKNMSAFVLKADACANITPRLIPTTPGVKTPDTHVTPTVPGKPPKPPKHTTTTVPSTLPPKVPKPLAGTMPHPQPGAGGAPENGMDPRNDSTETGYGPGDVPTATVAPTPTSPATTAPAGVEVGPPRQEAPSQTIATTVPVPQTPPPALGN